MTHTAYPTHTSAVTHLLVDKHGIIAPALCSRLPEDSRIVLVSEKFPPIKNITHVPYQKKIPRIPNIRYETLFFVWDGHKDMLRDLPEFFQKAKKDNAAFIFITSYHHMNDQLAATISSQYSKSYMFVLGDMFSGEKETQNRTSIDNLLFETKRNSTIRLENMGLKRLYPVCGNDVVDAIMKALQNPGYMGIPLHFFPKLPLTELAVVRIIQRFDPLLHVDFKKQRRHPTHHPEYRGIGVFAFDTTYPLHERLEQIYRRIVIASNEKIVLSKNKKEWKSLSPKEQNDRLLPENPIAQMVLLFIGYSIVIFALFPLTGTLLFGFLGQQSLVSSKSSIEKGVLAKAAGDAYAARTFFTIAEASGKFLYLESSLIGRRDDAASLLNQISAGKILAESMTYIFDAANQYQQVFAGKSRQPDKDFLNATNLLKNAIVNYQMLNQMDNVPESVALKIKKISPVMDILSNTVDALPKIINATGQRKYLVLFQNNMELRPGGGFIGSYGILTLDKGQIKDFTIHDVYDADGQLKGHIEPPFYVRRYMRIPHLYLRDSNFDVDFSKSAPISAKILASAMKEEVDGVIGLDLSFVKQVIAAVGPITVPEYNETVTAENFFLKTESHVEKNFFPGSTQKKDFLQSLMKALLTKIEKGNLPVFALLEKTAQAIKEKHVLFAFGDTNIQNIFTANGLSSSIWQAHTIQKGGIEDFIGVNEANIGINKVNYFIQRSINHHITILPTGELHEEHTMTYRNTSEKNVWPGGDYSNFMRVILPKGAVVHQISINGARQEVVEAITDPKIYESPSFVRPRGLEVQKYDQGDKTIYGFLVVVPAGANSTVSVSYTLGQKFDISKPFLPYVMKLFKQPGTENDPFSLRISYPGNFQVMNASSGFSNSDGVLSSIGYLSTDMLLRVEFTKK